MDIEGRRRSSNVEDRRGMRMVKPIAGVGLGGLLLIFVLSLLGINPLPFMAGLQQVNEGKVTMEQGDQPYQEGTEEARLRQLTEVVLADTEETWRSILPKYGKQYVEPTLVLFSGEVASACGAAESAVGPFYCPLDQKIYVDMSFYHDLAQRFGAPGDFAQAYVIAHEVGHHVQTLLGISEQVRGAQQRASKVEGNQIQVMMELQADCFAGVWAATAAQSRNLLQSGDVEEGLRAASAIGDDRIQRQTQGRVVPDAFTHGSSEQRMRWFSRGMQNGTLESCDTFNAQQL